MLSADNNGTKPMKGMVISMQGLIITLLICSLTMSALAIFYMLATPLLTKRYSATSCYYAWIIIVVGLIIPFRPQWGNSIVKVNMPSNAVIHNIQVGNGAPVIAPLENVLTSSLPTISLWQLAAVVWLTGMIIFIAYHVIKHYRFLKLVARWSKDITDEQPLILNIQLNFRFYGCTAQICNNFLRDTSNM